MSALAQSLADALLAAGGSGNTLKLKLPPTDKLEAMREVIAVLKNAQTRATLWYAAGLESYLADEGSSLEKKLGLTPKPGGRSQTVWALQQNSELQSRLREIAATIPGNAKAKAATIRKCVVAIHEGEKIAERSFDELTKLIVECGYKIPRTEWRIARIVEPHAK